MQEGGPDPVVRDPTESNIDDLVLPGDVVGVEVYDGAGQILHRTAVPFYLEQLCGVRVAQLPDYEKFLVQLDLGTMADVPVDELRVDMHVLDVSGKIVYKKTGQTVPTYMAVVEGETSDFDYGDYKDDWLI